MTLFEYYIQYMTQICEGTLPAPAGITLTETDDMRRATAPPPPTPAIAPPARVRAADSTSSLEKPP